jgi:hypothetical protein
MAATPDDGGATDLTVGDLGGYGFGEEHLMVNNVNLGHGV